MSNEGRFAEFCKLFCAALYNKASFFMIGGYDLAGAYCNWLMKHMTGDGADYIIDDSLCVYGVPIFRELALDDLRKDQYFGIVPNDRKYEEMFKRHGFETICLEDVFGCKEFGYYQWLEHKYGVDMLKTVNRLDFDYDYTHATNSGASRQMGLMDVIIHLRMRLYQPESMSVLDVGCGKGGAMEMFSNSVFAKVDGIELSKSICDIAEDNMKKLGSSAKIMNVSALDFDRYKDYDILYMYDPFRDEVFRQAVKLYEEAALERKKDGKQTYIVYANPYHHEDLIAGGIFQQVDAVDTDFFHRTVKIYCSAP